jgi:hypothetical protein
MQTSRRIMLAVLGGVVVAVLGVVIATQLGAYHFSNGGIALGGSSTSGGSVQVTGTIVTIDIFADTFVLKRDSGGNVTVKVNDATQYGGGAVAIGSFNPGQHVTVKGTKASNGNIQATNVSPA